MHYFIFSMKIPCRFRLFSRLTPMVKLFHGIFRYPVPIGNQTFIDEGKSAYVTLTVTRQETFIELGKDLEKEQLHRH
jgi:hypothetical protein